MPLFRRPKPLLVKAARHYKALMGIIAVLLAIAAYLYLPESCPEATRRTAAIFIIAAMFWAFEVLPLYATSLLVVLLLIFMLDRPGAELDLDKNGYTMFLMPFSSPIIMLFFGSFMLAKALTKYNIDSFLAERTVLCLGRKPYPLLFGLAIITAFLSMFVSNTAATAILLGLAKPLTAQLDGDDPFRKAIVLIIPFSANIGGIGTPVGTPPNAIALGNLAERGIEIPFVSWMMLTMPLLIFLLAVNFGVLAWLFPPKDRNKELSMEKSEPIKGKALGTISIFALTVLLWLTEPLHGIPTPLTALLAAGLLVITSILDRKDIQELDWDILVLMWGGLALGVGMKASGLTQWLITLPFLQAQGTMLVATFAVLAFVLACLVSNTATAALILPVALSLPGENPLILGITIALACSFGMILPVSTPPNTLAYSQGIIQSKDMMKAGAIISLVSLVTLLIGFKVAISTVFNIE